MTWAKYGTEFYDQLVDCDFPDHLSDACMNTHAQAIHYLYSVESMDMTFPKARLHRFATSPKAQDAADILVRNGLWTTRGNRYEVIHHADVFRQSLAAQQTKKEGNKERKRRERARKNGGDPDGPRGSNVTEDVTRDVTADTDRQTTSSYNEGSTEEKLNVNYETGEIFGSSSASSGGEYEASSSSGEVDPIDAFFQEASA